MSSASRLTYSMGHYLPVKNAELYYRKTRAGYPGDHPVWRTLTSTTTIYSLTWIAWPMFRLICCDRRSPDKSGQGVRPEDVSIETEIDADPGS